MAKTIRISYALPVTRAGGAALPVSEIAHVAVQVSADAGATFVDYGNVAAGQAAPQVILQDVDPGQYRFRFSVVDTQGRVGLPIQQNVTVLDDSPPGTVTNITVEIV